MEKALPTLSFEPLREADLDAVAELEKLCFSLPWSKALFVEELKHPGLSTWVLAREGGVLAGYMGTWKAADECHVVNLAVHPDRRRRGLGKALALHLLGLAKDQGCRTATLEVRASNAGAIRLYEGLGFKTVAMRQSYYSDNGEDALIMWKETL